ncbi:MAG: aminodeoxychorismate synthase component I [Bacteroidales bacterium]|nr:aminodeoxychorismate synthase component I [Bacteroidales bacterium]MDZ4204142.1 aminodeoxychorismate synthase component I [Bacteroidales bacterium]
MMNRLGKARTPFFFVLDFLLINPIVIPLKLIDNEHILFDIDGFNNAPVPDKVFAQGFSFKKTPPGFERYKTSFDLVKANLLYGNSYLLNLTLPSAIDTDLTLSEIFYRSKAAYKLWFRDRFVVFSPEMFVRIAENRIESHPMKGTIDASIPGAEEKILSDPKETAEHNTIVDLIRNDLSRIAQNVRVEKFRYITPVHTHQKKLLQVSSSVVGELAPTYPEKIGDIIFSLLPAGSVTGAPKKKTIEVILEAEQYDRGYYTGIFGYFDGQNLNSGVMIRFIENINGKFWFKSGGGITVNSCCEDEYQELIDKVYVPFV